MSYVLDLVFDIHPGVLLQLQALETMVDDLIPLS